MDIRGKWDGRETVEISHNRNRQRRIGQHPEERKSQREEKEGEVKLGNTRKDLTAADCEKHYESVWRKRMKEA